MTTDRIGHKLGEALEAIAKSDGALRERFLLGANELASVDPDRDMPQRFRRQWRAIWERMTRVKTDTGQLEATILGEMDDQEATELIGELFEMYSQVLDSDDE